MTNSRDVAEFFGRRHKNVLHTLDRMECSEGFRALNFQLTPEAQKVGATIRALHTFNIRMLEIDGGPWFVATDVCRALGLNLDGGSTTHLKKLDQDERQPVPQDLVLGSGRGMAQAALISEPGLYKLIAKPDKPAAKAFDRWAAAIFPQKFEAAIDRVAARNPPAAPSAPRSDS
ncbi:BRO family protein [Brucella anthropi]|uniref:BRO family protein n=1 Tax=Brucella anthropi TaxID=529 RepID=UPI003F737925